MAEAEDGAASDVATMSFTVELAAGTVVQLWVDDSA